jgi:hypothetical protein
MGQAVNICGYDIRNLDAPAVPRAQLRTAQVHPSTQVDPSSTRVDPLTQVCPSSTRVDPSTQVCLSSNQVDLSSTQAPPVEHRSMEDETEKRK